MHQEHLKIGIDFLDYCYIPAVVFSKKLDVLAVTKPAAAYHNSTPEFMLGESYPAFCQKQKVECSVPQGFAKKLITQPVVSKVVRYCEEISDDLEPLMVEWFMYTFPYLINKEHAYLLVGNVVTYRLRYQEAANRISALLKRMVGKTAEVDKRIERNAEFVVRYLESIIEQMPASVYWMDSHGMYVGGNNLAAELVGLKSRYDFIGKTNKELSKELRWSKSVAEAFDEDNKKVLEGISILHKEEMPFKTADGKEIRQLSNRVPLFNEKSEIIGVLGISVDITDLKAKEKLLIEAKERAEKLALSKTLFFTAMAHDVRTPLAGILSGLNYLKSALAKDEALAEVVHDTVTAARHLEVLLNDVINSGRSSLQDSEVERPFKLRTIIDHLVSLLKPSFKNKRLTFNLHYDDNLPTIIVGTPKQLYRVLMNLLGNAIKYTQQGHIEFTIKQLEVEEETIGIRFIVKDTGVGIPEAKLSSIFEPFVRVYSPHETEYVGSGLGLSMVKKIVENLKGNVYVTSTLGKGSTFTCDLVLRKSTTQILEDDIEDLSELKVSIEQDVKTDSKTWVKKAKLKKPISRHPVKSRSKSVKRRDNCHRILLVEDEPFIQRMTITLLKSRGFEVTLVDNGVDTIGEFGAAIQATPYNLILMDLGLPDMNGKQVTEVLRRLEASFDLAPIPIIGLTAHADSDEQRIAREAGMDEVFLKPLDPDMLTHFLN